jgi:2-polyprenyl-3-methyl-5-hydroxy-6-metoxy-1,4-benzoquinol methylase
MADCTICGETAQGRVINARSRKDLTLWRCQSCDFEFLSHDPTQSLAANKLDESRLKAAGLDIPALERDFANGIAQSQGYVAEYLEWADRDANILEVGCSWGYFLKLARDQGARVRGIELNTARARYVNEELGIPCDVTLEACEARGLHFRKIFLFYVLEYVPKPVEYIRRLAKLLESGGKLIMITPNLDDVLKDVWCNDGFRGFFYDEHAVNYMTPQSVRCLFDRLDEVRATVTTRQGYSFINHTSWFLTNAPRTTGVVGGDNFVSEMIAKLSANSAAAGALHPTLGQRIAELLKNFDANYRALLESADYGNQIRIVARK